MSWILVMVLALWPLLGGEARAADKLDLHVENVDDIAFYAIMDDKGIGGAVRICEWSVNPGCSGSVALTSRLRRNHTQMIVVGLCNKIYRGICLRPVGECGKYTGDFTLTVNGWSAAPGQLLWRRSVKENRDLQKDGNTYGTKALWGIKAKVDATGRIRLAERLSETEKRRLRSLQANEFANVCPR